MTTRLLRAAAVTVLAGWALLLGVAPALAHTRLLGSDPADGASLAVAPERVSLTFTEAVQPDFTTLTVIGPDGAAWQTSDVITDNGTASVAVRPLGPAGRYEIGYRVVSDDGHPVTGSVGFTLTAPGPGVASPSSTVAAPTAPTSAPQVAPTAADTDDGGAPVWPWIVGAVVLVGGGVVAALRLGPGSRQ